MANKKLTDLTELTTPADGDFLYIVDVSDTTESAQGTSKKIRKDKVDSGASKENIANKQNSLAIDGTGTKYPTVDAVNSIDLQKVIDVGGYAEIQNDTDIGYIDNLVYNEENIEHRVVVTDKIDPYGIYTSFYVKKIGSELRSINVPLGKSSRLAIRNGEVVLEKSSNTFRTTLKIDDPVEFTNLNFPAKTVAGTYTLATTDEVEAVDAKIPTTYSKVVYVNATSPTTATIFDTENPPVTNDNLLKNDTANLYIGTDASTWVYLTGTGYVTKTVSSATSNFNTFGTTVDAGNSKTSHITRSGAMTLAGPLNILNLKIATTPATSAGSYDILTRNSSTTALEKKLLSDFVTITGNQTKAGLLSFNNTSGVTNGLQLTNASSGAGATNYALLVNNTGSGGSGGLIANSNGGTGLYFESTNGKAIDMNVASSSGTGSGINIRSDVGNTGNLFNAGLGKVVINSAGKLSTTETPTIGDNVTNKTYVDSKITQTITNGVTDKSPSEDAVFDALANVSRNIILDAVPSTAVTGTISETILKSYLIEANTFSSSTLMKIPSFSISKTGTAGTAIIKIYFNSTNTLSGATQIGTYTLASATTYAGLNRTYILNGGDLKGFSFITSTLNDINSAGNGFSSTAFDTTTSKYIITSCTLSSSSDSVSQFSLNIVN